MTQPSRTWFDDEAPIAASWRLVTRRLGQRALASWPGSVAFALLVAVAVTFLRSRVPPKYEVTVVLRVSETVQTSTSGAGSSSDLGLGVLRTYVNQHVFTSARLLELIRRHPKVFPSQKRDELLALEDLRERLETEISDNDFVEERGFGDPPRSARIALSFRASDPEQAWTVAHELSDLLIDSTFARERAALERDESTAAATLRRAQSDFQELTRFARPELDPTVMAARERLQLAERTYAAAQIALRAATERQTLRLELVNPGHMPEPVDRSAALTTAFLLTFFITLAVSWLLVGAFDPRVLDGDDLSSLGVSFLGRTAALPMRVAGEEGRPRAPPAPRV